jgi:hypothetical protein
VFISYRRNDSKDIAGCIFDFLDREISGDQIHFDTTTFPIGLDFRAHIEASLHQSAGVLAVIGNYSLNRDWVRGQSWLFRFRKTREDLVRTEIELALQLNVPILPVLVDGIEMPDVARLPPSLYTFSRINATPVRGGRDFHADMRKVLEWLAPLRTRGKEVGSLQ